jgi:malate dehydrogenase (oxaloacetate-decarboxylating)
VFLDVGTDNAERIADPLYLGWKAPRVRGAAYDAFVERFVKAVKRRWPHVLLQWEDFAGNNAAKLLERYREVLPSFNDDIQGTAAVAVATVLAAVKKTGVPLTEQRFAILGFGSAGLGIAALLCRALVQAGLSEREARSRFFAVDKDGLLVEGMEMTPGQRGFAQKKDAVKGWASGRGKGVSLLEVVERARPTVLIGVSGQAGAFTEDVVRAMAKGVERPVILPLSNPTSRCEATPSDLLQWTEGRAIIGTGSPFGTVEFGGQRVAIAQTNNSYIFPGLALGIISARAKRVSEGMMMASAQALAGMSPTMTDKEGALLPPLAELRAVSVGVALAVGRQAAAEGLAGVKGEAFEEALRANVWEPRYLPYKRRR